MNPGTRLLLLLATLALVALLAGPLAAAEDHSDDGDGNVTLGDDESSSPWPTVRIGLLVVVVVALFMAVKLDDSPRFLVLGVASVLLLAMSLTLLPWYVERNWGTEEEWETGKKTQVSSTFQMGFTYFYGSVSIAGEKVQVWDWFDREDYDMILEGDYSDGFWLPLVMILLALVVALAALVTGLMGLPAARYLIATYAGLSLLAGLYFLLRIMMSASDAGGSVFDYESDDGMTKMTYLGLGWLSATLVVPLLGLWMFFIADAVGGEVTIVSKGGMTLSGVAGAPHAARRWEEDGGSLFGRDGRFAREAEAEEEYVPAAPPYGAAPTVVTPTAAAPVAPAYVAPQAPPSASAAPTAASPSGTTISCPSCAHSFAIIPTGGPQQVTCPACGTSGTMQL